MTDGGLARPVPVDTVEKMGADVTIAVNLHGNEFEEEDLDPYRMANRSLDLLRYHLSLYNVENADFVISPEVGGIEWNEFLNSEEAIEAGRKATEAKMNEIK